ncbi:MAG: ABC transporter permease [Thermonemataceae bacterium]|nr:ABC transporter permease [Thermonemataceae bacterium]
MKTTIEIAKTHLFAKKKQTLVASLGVTFGIAMFIVMIGFMTGINRVLENTALANSPHIRIYNEIKSQRKAILQEVFPQSLVIVHHQKPKNEKPKLKNGFVIIEKIKEMKEVWGVSAQLATQVFYSYGETQVNGNLAGVNILDEDKLFSIKDKLIAGDLESLIAANNGILMGSGLAKKLNIHIGDKITLLAPNGTNSLVKIVGIFKTGIGAIDNIKCYANIATVQRILQKDSHYLTEIYIRLKDANQARFLVKELKSRFGYEVEDWEKANETLLASSIIRNIMTYVVSVTLLVVAGFGIYNIINMTVYDKMKDIAILKAIGFDGANITEVFMYQAVFIGIMGGLAGLSLGFTLSFILSRTPFTAGEVLGIKFFPVNFDPRFYIFGLVFGVLTTCLAGYFPARKASKIDPVAILRG